MTAQERLVFELLHPGCQLTLLLLPLLLLLLVMVMVMVPQPAHHCL